MSGDDSRKRGLTFRGISRETALDRVTIHSSRGTSAIPGPDMEIYQEMAAAVQALDDLSNKMATLESVDEETRKLITKCRLLSVELRGELERRIR